MARVSFGSRAGSNSDYLVGTADHTFRHSTLNGSYSSIEELTRALTVELEAGARSAIPECTTCELALRLTADLPLLRPIIGPYADGGEHDLPGEFKTSWANLGGESGPGPNLPHATVHAVLTVSGDSRSSVQRAASRGIIHAIENVDGFKYSFNNAWAAKDEEGLRFSYICQDSMQNKDRHANGFTKTQKHLKSGLERGVRKATYDCKGSVSVKFSHARKCVDIYYRHYAIHPTVAERKPPARGTLPRGRPPNHKRSMPPTLGPTYPVENGGLLSTLQAAESAYGGPVSVRAPPPPPPQSRQSHPNGKDSLKRKREQVAVPPPTSPEKPLSLVDLLRQSEDANRMPSTNDSLSGPHVGYAAPPVSYDLPAWQTYQEPHAGHRPKHRYNNAQQPAPYPPPYPPPSQRPQQWVQSPTGPPNIVSSAHQSNKPLEQVPNAQGLFTTLKPMARADSGSAQQQHWVATPNGVRARTSCNHCRVSKKKCDGSRPMCGPCQKSHKGECRYEQAGDSSWSNRQQSQSQSQQHPQVHSQSSASTMQQYYSPAPTQQSQSQSQPQTSATMQNQYYPAESQQAQYPPAAQMSQENFDEESPDPWYPKR